jgi:hypothetical protein
MPISFDLEDLRVKHNCVNYFETGLYDPRETVSSKLALSCNFDKVFCIEIRKDWVELGKIVFKDHITTGKYNLYLDDSTNMKNYVMNNDIFKNKTMFFLDAHVDSVNIHNYKKKCPLFEELEAIKHIERKDKSYGDIDFLQQIKNTILSINKDYKFDTLHGDTRDDVLLAYIQDA